MAIVSGSSRHTAFLNPQVSNTMTNASAPKTPVPHPLATHDVNAAILNAHAHDRKALIHAHDIVIQTDRRRTRILRICQEALSQLRLDLKYLVFDLDATRRERDEAVAQLKEHGLR